MNKTTEGTSPNHTKKPTEQQIKGQPTLFNHFLFTIYTIYKLYAFYVEKKNPKYFNNKNVYLLPFL